MKSIILPLVIGLLLFAAISFRLRFSTPKEPARSLITLYCLFLAVLIVVYFLTPPDLGFLNRYWVAPSLPVDFGFAVFLYSAGFFGGLLQFYNLADRGLSLRMLIDILEAPRLGLTVDEISQGYSAGRGITWMYQKRLEGLTYAGLAEVHRDRLVLTSRGKTIALIFARLQSFAHLDEPGTT